MLKYLPLPDAERDNGSANYNRTSLIKSTWTQEYTVKLEHKITDKQTLSGFYLYNRSNEPCANYFGNATQDDPLCSCPLRLELSQRRLDQLARQGLVCEVVPDRGVAFPALRESAGTIGGEPRLVQRALVA